jgi:hypothetical protein
VAEADGRAVSTQTDPITEQSDELTGVNYLELTFGLFGGAAAWLFRLIINASLVPYSCAIGSKWPLVLVGVVTGAIAAASLFVAYRYYRRRPKGDDVTHIGTAGWLGLLGIMFNVLALSGIVLESVPIAFLDVCLSVFPAL